MKTNTALSLILLCFVLTSCAGFSRALQYTAQGMGARCASYICHKGYYEPYDGKYLMGYLRSTNDNGQDIAVQEEVWANNKAKELMRNSGIGVYYATSPYSNSSYKFDVRCDSWAN